MTSEKILYKHTDIHGNGDVFFVWQNGGSANLLASTGSDGTVAIFNRQGHLEERIVLHGLCCGFAWDFEGDNLGIITSNSSQVTLWDSNERQKSIIDTGLRDPLTCILWAKSSALMAVGTARGNLAIYNHQTSKRIPILGKHTKRIVCGAWSTENILALGSEDKNLSISTEDGDLLRTVALRDVPSDMQFAEMKTDERIPGENTVSMIIGKKTLYLYHLPEPESPSELGFQPKYGSLLQHKWFGDGYILLGFSNGYCIAISTHPKEVGQELWQIKNHRDNLTAIAVCDALSVVASCGDNNIKVHSTANLQETVNLLNLTDQSGVRSINWSNDGQLLGVSTSNGTLTVFVTKLPLLSAISPPRIALLSSLAEVSLYQYSPDKARPSPMIVQLEIEPTFLAVGSYHLACGMNNHIWFYDLGRSSTDSPMLLGDREYMAQIREVRVNSLHCAVLCGGQIMLHPIESQNPATKDQQPQLFPNSIHGMQESVISCLAMTSDFLIFASDLGNLVYFSLENWTPVIKYRHAMGIKQLFADCEGTKLVFIDDHNQGYVYTPANEDVVLIPQFPKTTLGVLWDYAKPSTFVAYDDKVCITYVFVKHSVDGKLVEKIGETLLVIDQHPLMLFDGDLSLSSSSGKLSSITLSTHLYSGIVEPKIQVDNLIRLRKFTDAWELCKMIDDKEMWMKLASSAIADLDVPFAIKVYRRIGNAAMVFSLEEILHIEDINYVAGYCAILLDRVDRAKTYFAKSVHPQEALELCRDLLQWEQAMSLAETLAPEQIPVIAREYAQQLEFTGNYSEALLHYEKGINYQNSDSLTVEQQEHVKLCLSGIARSSIKHGDYRKGVQIALQINDKELLNDCGEALTTIGHLQEAANLMEKAENWDKACSLYVQLKSWPKVQSILPYVTSIKLHAAYAQAKEKEGNFNEAIKSYTQAGDLDSVVRVYLDHLSDPHSASEIVLESRSMESSKMLAKFYQQIGDYDQALQFLILCGCISDAFALAQRHNKLRRYGELLDTSDNAQPSDYLAVAQYFEQEKYTLLAGKYYFLAKEYQKSLKYLLKASSFSNDENSALSLAIDCVATSNDDRLANQLIEFLLGETDGSPKDPKYVFRLYMARKYFKDAAKTAVIIGSQEQISGNYRSAHDLLFSMYQELRRNNLSVASDLKNNLALLHRYTLVRVHVKIGNHLLAAKLLVQVAAHISQFPTHIVPILTSTVIECHRAGLQKSAFTYAAMLMRPEHRSQIDSKYIKKIEAIVRKAPRGIKDVEDDFQQESTPCPVCDASLPTMDVACYQCKTDLPICIATGQHISKENLAACPECDFPCFKNEMSKILDSTNQCPMCAEIVDSNRLNDVENVASYLSGLS
ncbi:hypothetical protein HA402_008077 [Bradysia odoriphaga]|nr:hypothetical protein HA402_008077 [Bradysia odoriphaga]